MDAPAKSPSCLRGILNLADFEAAAERHLPRCLFGYLSGGVEDGVSLSMTRQSFRAYSFVPRVLVGVQGRTAETTLFDVSYSSPIGIAPMGLSALFAYRGDVVMARAAREAKLPMIMSGSSLIRMEEVVAANPETWFQAYLPGDELQIMALIDRIGAAGFKTLVITVDTPVPANRENNVRNGFSTPLRPSIQLAIDGISHPKWLFSTLLKTIVRHGMPHFENNYAERGAPILSRTVLRDFSDRGHLTWQHLERIRSAWPGNLVVKGVLNAADALKAVEAGADGVIVSNHGGRQFDGAIAPLSVLPEIVAALPSVPVMLDSGIRRGTDVLKAMALGAKFVFVGRPFGYAAAIAGQAGVAHAMRILRDELERGMGLLGVTSIDAINRSHIRMTSGVGT